MYSSSEWLVSNNVNVHAVGNSGSILGTLKNSVVNSDRIFFVINFRENDVNVDIPFTEIANKVGIFQPDYSYSTIDKQQLSSYLQSGSSYDISIVSYYFQGTYSYNINLYLK